MILQVKTNIFSFKNTPLLQIQNIQSKLKVRALQNQRSDGKKE